MKGFTLLLATILMLPLAASAAVVIHHPYARATPPNAPTSAVFMVLENQGEKEKTIISASTSAAGKVELHDHIMEGDVMKMRQIKDIKIPAMGKTELKPGSLHIMLFELQQDFKEGGEIEVTINYSDGDSQTFTAGIKKVMKGMMKH